MLRVKLQETEVLDGQDMWEVMSGKSTKGRTTLVEQGFDALAIIQDNWKYIEPNDAPAMNVLTNTELGNNQKPQLYNLSTDSGEKINLAKSHPKELKVLVDALQKIKNK